MIFVILGTQKFQFNRLLEALDKHKATGAITDEIFAQIGSSDYLPKCFSYIPYLPKDEFDKKMYDSDVVITHAGVGTIISSIKKEVPTIVVPRQKKYKEHIDDHQQQIALAFECKNLIMICDDLEELPNCIMQVQCKKIEKYESGNKAIVKIIETFLEGLKKDL